MMNFIRKPIQLSIILTGAFILSACGGGLDQFAQNTLYPFADVDKQYPVPEVAPEGLKSIYLDVPADDGTTMSINSWVYQSPNPATNRVYVYFHGNGENVQALYQFNFLRKMTEFNAHYVVMDYPGLGQSKGKPNEANLVNSAIATIDWAHQKFPRSTLIVWGRSLGASVATIATEKRQNIVDGLVLTSPWHTFIEMARALSKLIDQVPAEWLNKNRYESSVAAANIRLTTLIHHGTKDTLIPLHFGQALAGKFPDPGSVRMVVLPELGHNDIFTAPALWQDIGNFIR